MKLYAFDIPDATDDLASWLEQQLVGLHLGEIVAELAAVHDERPADPTGLDQILAEKKGAVVQQGLGVLSRMQLQNLLRHPELLLELQELVLSGGGEYWSRVAAENADSKEAAERSRPRALAMPQAVVVRPPQRNWRSHPLIVCVATAASVLFALWVIDAMPKRTVSPAPVAWGWNRPGALLESTDRQEYLKSLAAAADEWFKKTPTDARELATRIGQFRAGCSTLILAEHRPLPEADRQWLVDKCRAWATKIDGHLVALESGSAVSDVRTAMDDTVRKLSSALRDRASQG